jgi:hypothetical protein
MEGRKEASLHHQLWEAWLRVTVRPHSSITMDSKSLILPSSPHTTSGNTRTHQRGYVFVPLIGAVPSPGARKPHRYVHIALILALLAASLFYYPQLWRHKVDQDAGKTFSWGEVSAALLAQSNNANQ